MPLGISAENLRDRDLLARLRSEGGPPPGIRAEHQQMAQRLAQARQDPRIIAEHEADEAKLQRLRGKKLSVASGKLVRRNFTAWGAASRSSFQVTTRAQNRLLPPTADAPADQVVILGSAVPRPGCNFGLRCALRPNFK
jgi:hypothetical protein